MKFGFSTNAFTNNSLDCAIESISKIGYDGIEIVVDKPHIRLPLPITTVHNLKKKLKQKNLELTNLNANTSIIWYGNKPVIDNFEPSLSNINGKLRAWRINYTKYAIDLAHLLDCPSICITSGTKNNFNDFELFINSLSIISEYAEKKNILIAIEYEPGLLIETAETVYSFIKKFPMIGLNLDVCHAYVLNENIDETIQKFDKKIYHTHFSDCKNHIHYHLIPGLGEIDFKLIIDSLTKIKYNGFLTAELYTYSNDPERAATETLNYLSQLVRNR